jgi:hypothetical protein
MMMTILLRTVFLVFTSVVCVFAGALEDGKSALAERNYLAAQT